MDRTLKLWFWNVFLPGPHPGVLPGLLKHQVRSVWYHCASICTHHHTDPPLYSIWAQKYVKVTTSIGIFSKVELIINIHFYFIMRKGHAWKVSTSVQNWLFVVCVWDLLVSMCTWKHQETYRPFWTFPHFPYLSGCCAFCHPFFPFNSQTTKHTISHACAVAVMGGFGWGFGCFFNSLVSHCWMF